MLIRTLGCIGVVAAACIASPCALAQGAYPTKTIRIIAPVQPGGGVDLVARQVGERLSKALGQPVVIENQSGGGGIVGSQATARAAPDGYTLMVGYVGTHGTNPAVRKLPVRRGQGLHADRDGRRHAERARRAAVAAGEDAAGVHRLRQGEQGQALVRLRRARARSRILRWSSSRSQTDLDMTHVAYRGIGPAITDILGGQTQALFPGLAAALPHIKAGKMRPLAVTGTKRHPLLPDVPTFEELGFKGFDGVQWYGIVGPANMPPAIVTTLNNEINKMLADPAFSSGSPAKRWSRCR